jgi:ATP-dependent 26S proteasome regulatory subunit
MFLLLVVLILLAAPSGDARWLSSLKARPGDVPKRFERQVIEDLIPSSSSVKPSKIITEYVPSMPLGILKSRVRKAVGHDDDGDSDNESDGEDDPVGPSDPSEGLPYVQTANALSAQPRREREDSIMDELAEVWRRHLQAPGDAGGPTIRQHPLFEQAAAELGALGRGLTATKWFERGALLGLRSAAAAAHHPGVFAGRDLGVSPRGLRLGGALTHTMEEVIAAALAQSAGAAFVAVDDATFAGVRAEVGRRASKGQMLQALFGVVSQEPTVVFVRSKGACVFSSRSAAATLTAEIVRVDSKALVIVAGSQDLSTDDGSADSEAAPPPSPAPQLQPQPPEMPRWTDGSGDDEAPDSDEPFNLAGADMPPGLPEAVGDIFQQLNKALEEIAGTLEGGDDFDKLSMREKLQNALMDEALAKQLAEKIAEKIKETKQPGQTVNAVSIEVVLKKKGLAAPEKQQGVNELPQWVESFVKRDTPPPPPRNAFAAKYQQMLQESAQKAPPPPGRAGMAGSAGKDTDGQAVLAALQGVLSDVVIAPPRDATLRGVWEGWIDAEKKQHCAKTNAATLASVMSANRVSFGSGAPALLRAFGEALGHAPLPTSTARAVVLAALKVEVARRVVVPGRVDISEHALALALATVCAGVLPSRLPGMPLSRSKEEMAELAADKHERALLTNVVAPADIGVSYDSIGGLASVKELLRQCITYPLKYPHLYSEGIAAEAPKGVLLFGPPGTGKTMLAKAVATEGGATFLHVDASSIENKWLGESEKNARAIFTLARRLAPCVIYIDEMDSILSSRENGDESSHGTLTSVKTTIMQEWDGLRSTKDRVVVIGSTNRPFDLDEAVLRRMPRRILVDLPDLPTREAILAVSLANNRVAPDVNLTAVAQRLAGYTGSDIKEVCREAVVRISHEAAHALERALAAASAANKALPDETTSTLRPVTRADLETALTKLTASVNERGREIARVADWNEQYGEVKKPKKRPHLPMYL